MAGNITTIEQIKRLKNVKRLKSEGQTNQQVADELDIPLTSVQRATQQLKKIDVSDLSPTDIAEQRGTLDLEFQEIAEYAKDRRQNAIHSFKENKKLFMGRLEEMYVEVGWKIQQIELLSNEGSALEFRT